MFLKMLRVNCDDEDDDDDDDDDDGKHCFSVKSASWPYKAY